MKKNYFLSTWKLDLEIFTIFPLKIVFSVIKLCIDELMQLSDIGIAALHKIDFFRLHSSKKRKKFRQFPVWFAESLNQTHDERKDEINFRSSLKWAKIDFGSD